MMLPDLIIAGGQIADGSGDKPYAADLVVKDGRIQEIGTIEAGQDIPRIDASNLLVAPGFIDIHSHSDFTLLVDPRAVSSIAQGVTLEVLGNCGHGCAPVRDPDLVKGNIYGYREDRALDWQSMAQYLERLERARPAVNALSLVPNGNLRLATAGRIDRPSTAGELAQMEKLLQQGLEEGAFGYSTGLEYGAEFACAEEEIVALCRVCSAAAGFYATHTRNRQGEARETIAEAIRTAAAAEVPLQISHISVVARLVDDGDWAVAQALDQVDEACKQGLDVGFDMHTRLFGTTNLSAALPPWTLEGERAAIAARLKSPATRRELKTYPSIINALARGDWARIVLGDCKAHPECSRRSIAEIAEARGVEPVAAICDMLLDEIDDLHGLLIIAHSYRAEDLRRAFAHPACMIGSDATALAPDGPLADSTFHGAYTWAAWFFRHFVRDTRMLTSEEAVRRLTSLPASRLQLKDRGVIRPGACADLAIFDPRTFGERGTLFEPNQTAVGMVHVLVNGVVAVENGELSGRRGGQVLRR